MDKPLSDGAFVVENQIQRPHRNAQHYDDVGQRANLHVNLIGDNRHRYDQPVTNQATQGAEA